jgi:hypothetical protein
MGGELTYRTSEEGSVFTLTLPSKDNADEKKEESVVATSRSN